MGDGQTAFNNFVYFTLAGFSEFDHNVSFINLNFLEDFFNIDESSRN